MTRASIVSETVGISPSASRTARRRAARPMNPFPPKISRRERFLRCLSTESGICAQRNIRGLAMALPFPPQNKKFEFPSSCSQLRP